METYSLYSAMAKLVYEEVMAQYGNEILPSHHPYSQMVTRVAQRIVNVSGISNIQWEFHVIHSPEKNAIVLPGGKVFVFTGILPIVENEDGLAAVLGHEIAHQVARHSAEKLTMAKILFASRAIFFLLGIDVSFIFNTISMNYLMMMPFSRKCETEADIIGIRLMAHACFDPREALKIWHRMKAAEASNGFQFLSTHPSNDNRIKYLKNEMPLAISIYENNDCHAQLHNFRMFKSEWMRQ
ncbi:peptidase family M48-domain-containing protein [Spinellus fusiger]|nr:peptidase family M48-domain-containing protein [Spinellus fusiger]